MPNKYYNATGLPTSFSPLESEPIRSEFAAISSGFAGVEAELAEKVGATATQTLKNKTINLAENTVIGTLAQFNAAVTDNDLCPLSGPGSTQDFTVGQLTATAGDIQTVTTNQLNATAGDIQTVTTNQLNATAVSATTLNSVNVDELVSKVNGIESGATRNDAVGVWTNGTTYNVGDMVIYSTNNNTYRCLQGHTASLTIRPTTTTHWELVSRGTTNLLDIDWEYNTAFNGGTPMFPSMTANENTQSTKSTPYARKDIVWECGSMDTSTGFDGGWVSRSVWINPYRTYRFSVFVYCNVGTITFGLSGSVCTLNTTTPAPSPYFLNGGTIPTTNWYLLVGYVYPYGTTGNQSLGGVYKVADGSKYMTLTDFNWSTSQWANHVCHANDVTSITNVANFYAPRIDLCDGSEPSLTDLLGQSDALTRLSVTQSRVLVGTSTDNGVDKVQVSGSLYASDGLKSGAGLSFVKPVTTVGAFSPTHKVPITINGTTYYMALTTS